MFLLGSNAWLERKDGRRGCSIRKVYSGRFESSISQPRLCLNDTKSHLTALVFPNDSLIVSGNVQFSFANLQLSQSGFIPGFTVPQELLNIH